MKEKEGQGVRCIGGDIRETCQQPHMPHPNSDQEPQKYEVMDPMSQLHLKMSAWLESGLWTGKRIEARIQVRSLVAVERVLRLQACTTTSHIYLDRVSG